MRSHPLNVIVNFLPLSQQLASAGQPAAEQFSLIQQAGYQAVINLTLPTSSNAIPNEGELVTRLGMTYIHIPVQWEGPTADDYLCFQRVMHAFRDKKVFVHCALNMRVSCFLFLFRVLNQVLSIRDARHDLEKIWLPNQVWQKFIDDMLEKNNHKLGLKND